MAAFTISQQGHIAENLKKIRQCHSLTQARLSAQTGIPKNTLLGYEFSGQISVERLQKLADYYEVPLEDFLGSWEVLYSHISRSYLS